jgi:hypothetical protein
MRPLLEWELIFQLARMSLISMTTRRLMDTWAIFIQLELRQGWGDSNAQKQLSKLKKILLMLFTYVWLMGQKLSESGKISGKFLTIGSRVVKTLTP